MVWLVFGVSSLTRTCLDVTVLVLHRWSTARDGGTLPLRSGAGSPTGAVAFGTTLRAARPRLPWRPASTRHPYHRRLQELLHEGCREKGKECSSRLDSQECIQCCQMKEFRERHEACRFFECSAGIFLCLSFSQTVSVSLMYPTVPCCRCFICLSESKCLPHMEADRGRQVIDSREGGMKKPPAWSSKP